jgi:uncharacterized membrane protein YciS (DUF1049 family)
MTEGVQALGVIFGFVGILISIGFIIFWMVVAWRAMRAHERLAEHHKALATFCREIADALKEKNK